MVNGKYEATNTGTPQGGICKALHNPPYAKKATMQRKSWITFAAGIYDQIYFA
jgi:hypothetical protein